VLAAVLNWGFILKLNWRTSLAGSAASTAALRL
jgi:hypothetical protein